MIVIACGEMGRPQPVIGFVFGEIGTRGENRPQDDDQSNRQQKSRTPASPAMALFRLRLPPRDVPSAVANFVPIPQCFTA